MSGLTTTTKSSENLIFILWKNYMISPLICCVHIVNFVLPTLLSWRTLVGISCILMFFSLVRHYYHFLLSPASFPTRKIEFIRKDLFIFDEWLTVIKKGFQLIKSLARRHQKKTFLQL